jgi:hypothetical protein
MAPDESDARPKISPAMWRPLEQVTGFNPYLLYDWFGHITHNFQEYDESSLAEVADMTTDEKVRHKQRAAEHIKIIAFQLKQNVEACCSTFFKLATELNKSELYTAGRRFRATSGRIASE